jgi:hypothetical protein
MKRYPKLYIPKTKRERLQVGSRHIRSAATADTRAEQTIRRRESNTLSDMDAADE